MEDEQIIPASKDAPKDPSGMNKALVIAIVVLLLAAIGGIAYWFGTQRKAPEPTSTSIQTVTPEESPTGSPTATPKPTKSPKPTPTPTPTVTSTPISFQVTSVVVAASVPGGACPKTVNFSANITTNAGGTVTYKWERSDNAGAPTESITFGSAGTQTVSDTWQLVASYSGWERVHIIMPNDTTSNQANFTLTCP